MSAREAMKRQVTTRHVRSANADVRSLDSKCYCASTKCPFVAKSEYADIHRECKAKSRKYKPKNKPKQNSEKCRKGIFQTRPIQDAISMLAKVRVIGRQGASHRSTNNKSVKLDCSTSKMFVTMVRQFQTSCTNDGTSKIVMCSIALNKLAMFDPEGNKKLV
ncbi:hypothetical protein BJX63DRAFT_209167 [Aspergillus granulosus]|uniref:Uncharacterized protein n=1 Tax=Aspergillus granulosus TaxID=176169 RepID=A0ABR4HEK1_9EURO